MTTTRLALVLANHDPTCLHCALMREIFDWTEQHAVERAGGVVILNMAMAIAHLAMVVGELVHSAPGEAEKAQFERYARECLEGAFKQRRTGEPVEVVLGAADGVH